MSRIERLVTATKKATRAPYRNFAPKAPRNALHSGNAPRNLLRSAAAGIGGGAGREHVVHIDQPNQRRAEFNRSIRSS